jgi:hypothetical protein
MSVSIQRRRPADQDHQADQAEKAPVPPAIKDRRRDQQDGELRLAPPGQQPVDREGDPEKGIEDGVREDHGARSRIPAATI